MFLFFIFLSPECPNTITLALAYCFITAIEENSDLNTKHDLPRILTKIDPSAAASLPGKISNLVAKVKKLAAKCSCDDDVQKFLMKELGERQNTFIGEECQKIGITSEVLEGNTTIIADNISELVLTELEMYRGKMRASYDTLVTWLKNILGWAKVNNVNTKVLKAQATALKNKRVKAYKKKDDDTKQNMRNAPFQIPRKPSLRRYAVARSHVKPCNRPSTPRCRRCTILKKQLQNKRKDYNKLYLQTCNVKGKEKALNMKECELNKKNKYLYQKESNLIQLDSLLSESQKHYKPVNVDKREYCLKVKIDEQKDQIQTQNDLIDELRVRSKSKSDTIRNLTKKTEFEFDVAKLERENVELKMKKKALIDRVKELEYVETELKELRDNQKPMLKGKGKGFVASVYECYMKLAACDVSSKYMSIIVASVLSIVGKMSITEKDLPKATKCKEFAGHANVAASLQVAESLENAEFATLHSDGTTRDGKKVVDYEVTGKDGDTLTAGLIEVSAGDAETQLEGLKFIVKKLASLQQSTDITKQSKTLISKIKTTMGDQAATQKSFNEKLQKYRESILPDVVEQWATLDGGTQAEILRMNHFFCNLHALIGCATYCDDVLKELEKTWRGDNVKLGVEGLKEFQDAHGTYTWKHPDSATQRLVRTACDALSPGGDQKSGAIGHFQTYRSLKRIPKLYLRPFRANRFNILFELSAGVWYHRTHIQDFFSQGYCLASNKLLKAVYADSKCTQLLAGVRSLGIIHKHITEPFWRLVEHADVHVLDISAQVQHAHAELDKLSQDATPLLTNTAGPFFSLPNGDAFEPVKDEIFLSLYEKQSEETDQLTKVALEVECTSMLRLFNRRFSDQLSGKYSGNVSDQVREETKHTSKTNKRGENDFGYWSYLMESKPSLSEMHMEGRVMYRLNKTDKYLENLRDNDPRKYEQLMETVRKQRRNLQKIYTEKKETTDLTKARRMEEKKMAHDIKQAKAKERDDSIKRIVAEVGEFKTPIEVDDFIAECSTKKRQMEMMKAQMQYLKKKYEDKLTKLPNAKKLMTVTKTPELLKEDLKAVVEFLQSSNPHQEASTSQVRLEVNQEESDLADHDSGPESDDDSHQHISSDDDDDLQPPQKKRKTGDESSSDLKSGDIVAVAWEKSWFPGLIVSIPNPTTCIITYTQHYGLSKRKFKWGDTTDVQETHVDSVLLKGLELLPDSSGRYCFVEEDIADELDRRFNAFCNKCLT